jgi:hypothetical protein
MPVVRLSIVIPVLGKLKKLEDTLVSVLENRPVRCEIVVVLNEPYDDPYELAEEVCFVQAPFRANLVDCLNLGIAASRGAVIHTLGCGTEVTPGWSDAALSHFERPEVAAVAASIIDQASPQRTISTGVAYQPGGATWRLGCGQSADSSPPRLPAYFGPDLAAAFYRKSALDIVGGFSPEFPGELASADLALALHFTDRRCVLEPHCRVLAARSDFPAGERLHGGCEAERLFWRWARRMGWFHAGAGHAALLVNECLESIVRPTTLLRLLGRARETMLLPLRGRNEFQPPERGIPQESVIACPHFQPTGDKRRPLEVSKAS